MPSQAEMLERILNQHEAMKRYIRKLENKVDSIDRPQNIWDIINSIPGRRAPYTPVGTQTFDTSSDGAPGSPITFTISQDGPFIMTDYPLVQWKPSSPANATNFGRWRPVSHYPLPDQVLDTDLVSISYRWQDDGTNRQFQNENAIPGSLLSQPWNLVSLPQPYIMEPNTTISFTPTYEDIEFNSSDTATTGGTLVVALLGFKIANLG